jgi:hypothetical protein
MNRPLSGKLVAAAVCLLAVGAAVITGACALVARGYLMGQADQQLRAYAEGLTGHPFEVNPLGGLSPGTPVPGASAFSIEVRGPGGQLVLRAAPGSRPAQVLPPVSPRAGQLVTASAGGESWRMITEPVRYHARRILFAYSPQDFSLLVTGRELVTGRDRAGTAGTLVVGIGLASVGQAVGQLVTTGLVVSGVTILVATCLGAALIRAIRRAAVPRPAVPRPATQAERTGPSGAHPAFAETLRELRKPVSVVHGLARDHRRRGPLSAADADRTMARVAGAARRMDALLAGLPRSRSEPSGRPKLVISRVRTGQTRQPRRRGNRES